MNDDAPILDASAGGVGLSAVHGADLAPARQVASAPGDGMQAQPPGAAIGAAGVAQIRGEASQAVARRYQPFAERCIERRQVAPAACPRHPAPEARPLKVDKRYGLVVNVHKDMLGVYVRMGEAGLMEPCDGFT